MSIISKWLKSSAYAGFGDGLEKTKLSLGFIPLTDCAPLIVAKEKGWFEKYGLEVELSKETSWANLRDKVSIGILDGAQMLAPMPLASTLGVGPVEKPTLTALSLDLNGNAITVSQSLFAQMRQLSPEGVRQRPMSAEHLKKVIEERQAVGKAPLTFAVVFPVSTHNYQLRYWMGAAGIDPDKDVRLVVVPPPQMVTQLTTQNIDGYCVGEPWNSVAVAKGVGRVLITSYEIWNNCPEKVFGVNQEWAEQYPNTHRALLMALLEAGRWADAPDHREDVVEMISVSRYINAHRDIVKMSMTGSFCYDKGEDPVSMTDFNLFFRYGATYPWRSHAQWFLTQMMRWGDLAADADTKDIAKRVYRPDLYAAAAAPLDIPMPGTDQKTEGTHARGWILEDSTEPMAMGPDRFFDGAVFDPDKLDA